MDNGDIPSAAAKVAREHVTDAIFRGIGLLSQKRMGCHQDTRRAKAALHCEMFAKSCLQWRQSLVVRNTFDRNDLHTLHLNRKDKTGSYCGTINDNSAGTAGTVSAAYMRAGETQIMTKAIRKSSAWLHLHSNLPAVHIECHVHCLCILKTG
jgi:hypothetical protein